jgi:hypothetical protein
VPAAASPQGQGEQVWFGTGANVLCTTSGAFFSEVDAGGYNNSVCEYGESPVLDGFPNLPAQYGDWYPPKMYQFDVETKTLIDRTPYSDYWRNRSMGIRSAGYHNGVVFMAGGGLGGGISIFAWNAATGAYIGSRNFPEYRTIRKWVVVNNILYTGMGTEFTGRVLRWTGSVSNPWSFAEVGRVNGVPREISEYIDNNGRRRLAVSARGIWLSPAMQYAGLIPAQATSWTQIWGANQYDPDFVTRSTYVGGGIAYLNGWLYFATMHIPGNAADLHHTCSIPPYGISLPSSVCFGDTGDDEYTSYKNRAISRGTGRATSIWRIKNAESSTNRVTQLLYGEAELPSYDPNYPPPPAIDAPSEEWTLWYEAVFPKVPNLGGYVPLLGTSGFDNACNNYGWVMEAVGAHLFVGTMDYCSVGSSRDNRGADLWRIDGTTDDVPVAAVAETLNAFKCTLNGDVCAEGETKLYTYAPYGFRTLTKSQDGTKIYAGMATGTNVGAVGDGAGWQLLELDSNP